MRSVRQPPEQAVFDAISIPPGAVAEVLAARDSWHRLARLVFASQLYASPATRLTPRSRVYPCVYLAENEETAVAEVWGDRFYAQRESGRRLFSIEQSEADQWGFFRIAQLPALNLCDLTDAAVKLATGIDSATLYSTDLAVPQGWAECVARHPQKFDGILYRSRHTEGLCIVAWNRPDRRLELEMSFVLAGPFLHSTASYAVAKKTGIVLSFPA